MLVDSVIGVEIWGCGRQLFGPIENVQMSGENTYWGG